MNGSGSTATTERPSLGNDVDQLASTITELNDRTNALLDRIGPLLRPLEPQPECPADEKAKSQRAPFANMVLDQKARIAAICGQVNDALDRLEF